MGATIRQKNADNRWWLFINHQGIRTSKCLGRIDKRQAEQIRKQVAARLAENVLGLTPAPRLTVAAYASEWLAGVELKAERGGKYATYARYRIAIERHLLPHLGTRFLADLTDKDGKTLLQTWARGSMSYWNARTTYTIVRTFFITAMDEGHIARVPLPKLQKVFERQPQRKEAAPIPPDELSALLHVAEQKCEPPYPTLFRFLAKTGCRLGEALALTWDNVNVHHAEVRIEASYGRYGLSRTKTGAERTVPMTPQTVDALRRLQIQQRTWALEQGTPTPPWVFTTPALRHVTQKVALARWQRCCKAVGTYVYRLHDLRHTYVSQRLAHNDPILAISKAIGHASPTMTLNVYGHLIPGDRPDVTHLDAPVMHPHPRTVSAYAGGC